jgi:hypothetical protein
MIPLAESSVKQKTINRLKGCGCSYTFGLEIAFDSFSFVLTSLQGEVRVKE